MMKRLIHQRRAIGLKLVMALNRGKCHALSTVTVHHIIEVIALCFTDCFRR